MPAIANPRFLAISQLPPDLFAALIYLPSDLQKTTLPVGLALFQRL